MEEVSVAVSCVAPSTKKRPWERHRSEDRREEQTEAAVDEEQQYGAVRHKEQGQLSVHQSGCSASLKWRHCRSGAWSRAHYSTHLHLSDFELPALLQLLRLLSFPRRG